MCFTIDKLDKSCGFLLINECNVFLYCCKMCSTEFGAGSDLEEHILFDHLMQDKNIDSVFVKNISNVSKIQEEQNNSLMQNLCTELEMAQNSTEMVKNNESDDVEMIEEILEESTDESIPSNDDDTTKSSEIIVTSQCKNKNRTADNLMNIVVALEIEATDVKVPQRGKPGRKPSTKKAPNCKNRTKRFMNVFYCDMCPNITLSSIKLVRRHMKRHCENRLLKLCPICKKKPRDFDKHMKLNHLDERPYKCAFCDAAFRTNLTRIVHMRGHTKEKPFLCEMCGKTFSSQSGKSKHEQQVHATQRPHKCTTCERTFPFPSDLREHIFAIHSTEKPYTCDICDTAYSTKYNLRLHKLTHGEKTKKCRFCEKMFKTPGSRRSHEKQVHKEFRIEQEYKTVSSVN